MKQYATVTGATEAVVSAYLPDNYTVVGTGSDGAVVIGGRDVAGWTLQDYVIPRLASGRMIVIETHKEDK